MINKQAVRWIGFLSVLALCLLGGCRLLTIN